VSTIVYAREQDLSPEDYIAVVGSTYMRARRPVANRKRIEAMLRASNLIVSARNDAGAIVGLARGISDDAWVCYLADVVVREDQHGKGIGRGLMAACKRVLGPSIAVVLIAYPEAADFYRRIGMGEMTAFYFDREISG
jgi:predicted GNAT family N-acyltransferase